MLHLTMPTPSKNAPCPCGSGAKYKKCCLPKDQAAAPPPVPIGARILQRNGERFMVSEGVTDEALGHAADYFEAKRRGRGPAQQLAEYAQPLLDSAGDGIEDVNQAMSLAMICWNLALCQDEGERENLLVSLSDKLPVEQARTEFRAIAAQIIYRCRSTICAAMARTEFRAIAAQMVERHR